MNRACGVADRLIPQPSVLGPRCKQAHEHRAAVHAEAAYLRGGGGRARGEAGLLRRVRDPALGAHRNEPESPPSPAPPRGPACARARPTSPTPRPCNLHATRAAPPSLPERPQPRGLSTLPPPYTGSWAALGSRTFRKAPRFSWVKGQVASFPGGACSFTSAADLEKPRKCSPFLPPPATRIGRLRGVLATNRRARWSGRLLSR